MKISEGELLLILVRRTGKDTKQVAADLDITPQYLSTLFKKNALPQKVKEKVVDYFKLSSEYFSQDVSYVSSEDKSMTVQQLEKEVLRLGSLLEEKMKEDKEFYQQTIKELTEQIKALREEAKEKRRG